MRENDYQAQLIRCLRDRFPGCVVLKNDSDYLQGVPDLLVLYRDTWAALEVKTSRRAKNQPNQEYYIETFGEMSFAAFIYPEVEEEVLDDLQQTFESRRAARLSQCQ